MNEPQVQFNHGAYYKDPLEDTECFTCIWRDEKKCDQQQDMPAETTCPFYSRGLRCIHCGRNT